MHRTPKVLEVQERARSPCQVWWGLDFSRHRGSQKRCFYGRPI